MPPDDDLVARVCDLERRVAALEHASDSAAQGPQADPAPHPSAAAIAVSALPGGIVPVVGRALLGIAGAYLLRAIAESGIVPQLAAVFAALIYAGWWLVSSGRVASGSRFTTAVYGLTAALVVSPMLWETTVRFQVLPPQVTAAILVLFVVFGAALAWPRDLAIITWITTLAGVATALALIVATREVVTFAAALLVMAIIVEYAACRDHWLSERWLVALTADTSVFLLAYVVARPNGPPEGYPAASFALVMAFQVALIAIYFGSAAYRTLVRCRAITWFEIVQCVAAFGIFTVGAVSRSALGIVALIGGMACYAVVLLLRRQPGRNRNAYAVFGFAFTTLAVVELVSGTPLVLAMCAASVAVFCLKRRLDAAAFLLAAAIAAHAPAQAAGIISVAFVSLGVFASGGLNPPAASASLRASGFVNAAVFCWTIIAVSTFVPLGPSMVAALRTAVVCVLGLVLAWAGPRWNRPELSWLILPLMAFGAFKLLFEDFGRLPPAAIAVSLLLYGGTLMVAPRFARKAKMQNLMRAEGVLTLEGEAAAESLSEQHGKDVPVPPGPVHGAGAA